MRRLSTLMVIKGIGLVSLRYYYLIVIQSSLSERDLIFRKFTRRARDLHHAYESWLISNRLFTYRWPINRFSGLWKHEHSWGILFTPLLPREWRFTGPVKIASENTSWKIIIHYEGLRGEPFQLGVTYCILVKIVFL